MSNLYLTLFFLSIFTVYAELNKYTFSGSWKSSSTLSLLNSDSGQTLIRKYLDSSETAALSILLQTPDPSLLFIQTAIPEISAESIQINSSNFTLFSNKRKISNFQADLNCTFNKKQAFCSVDTENSEFHSFNVSGSRITTSDMQEPTVSYSFIISCVSITLILAFSKHTQDCIASEAIAKKTPIEFLLLQSAIDLWFSIWHLYLSSIYYVAHEYLVLAAFMTFAVYLVIHGRLLMHTWRAQNPALAQDGVFFFRIRFSIFESFWIIFILSFVPVFIILSSMKILIVIISHSYLPLIYKSARHGYKNCIRPDIIVTITLARMFLLLYLFGFEHEFTGPADYSACLAVVLYLGVQGCVVLLQNKHPRFFLPQFCRPDTYSYFRDVQYERVQDKNECIICMTELNLSGQEAAEVLNYSRTMHTPCKHMFHEDCLNNWMSIKMECPTCRTPLPLVEE